MFSFLNNIPPVTKNLLILNVLLFLLKAFFKTQGTDLDVILGTHYFNSTLFEPYQLVSHMFMHADIAHLFFNMFGLLMFGGFLERLWGAKRFFIFYFASAIGALVLYNVIGVIEIMNLKQQLAAAGFTQSDFIYLNESIETHPTMYFSSPELGEVNHALVAYQQKSISIMMGASGAVFGIMAAFAILFPNTELMLLFLPFPIKAKYLIGGYFVYELVSVFYQQTGDNVAHLAHVGGAIVGAIFVFFWRRNSKRFY